MFPRWWRVASALQHLERACWTHLMGRSPPTELAVAFVEAPKTSQPSKKFSLTNLIGDGFLMAVPKFRTTIERRWKRKYGSPGERYVWKMLVPKTNLKACSTCGHHHERGVLCGNCYNKIELETKAIQDKIQENLGTLKPIEQDVIVLYEGETVPEQVEEFWKGKRVIEMKKERPNWFSKNLLQKTTQQPSNSTDVKPNDLA